MGKNVNERESKAKAIFVTGKLKVEEVVTETHRHADTMKKHPDYGGNQAMQAAVTEWVGAADAVDTTSGQIAGMRTALRALLATQDKNLDDWKRATGSLVAVVNKTAAGSAQAVKAWGFPIAGRSSAPATSEAPTSLRATYNTRHELVIRWDGTRDNRGYFVQIGDGTPSGWGAPIPCPKPSFSPPASATGQKVALRVAVQRKGGMSDWSDALLLGGT